MPSTHWHGRGDDIPADGTLLLQLHRGSNREGATFFETTPKARFSVKEQPNVCIVHDCKRELQDAMEGIAVTVWNHSPCRDVQSHLTSWEQENYLSDIANRTDEVSL